MILNYWHFIQISCQEIPTKNDNQSMIRYISIILFLALGIMSAKSQEMIQGSFAPLLDYRVATVNLDLSCTDVAGQTIEDFIKFKTYEEGENYPTEFQKDVKSITGDFIDEFNDTNCPLLLTAGYENPLNLTAKVETISRKGNSISCKYIFWQSTIDSPIVIIQLTSKDGRVGSFTNLMGDAFEKAGKDLGKYVKRQLKQAQKEK